MLNDEDLVRTLRSALPPVAMSVMAPRTRTRDLWPQVVDRTRRRTRWSAADWSAAAAIVIALLMFPKWFWFLAYHL
jgi:hypothetical protein